MTTTYDGKVFSNEDLKVGDKVFPIGNGKCDGDKWILEEYDFRDFMCGYPDDPHIIKNLNYSSYKPYQVHTSHGYGPIEEYYKIIENENL